MLKEDSAKQPSRDSDDALAAENGDERALSAIAIIVTGAAKLTAAPGAGLMLGSSAPRLPVARTLRICCSARRVGFLQLWLYLPVECIGNL